MPFPLPEIPSLSVVDLELGEITFMWSPVAPDCPAISYNIIASNCGSCPTNTNHTNITCVDIPTDDTTCVFAVSTVVCGNITGNVSSIAQGSFKGNINNHNNIIPAIIKSRCIGATASASVFAIGLLIVLITMIIVILIKANKQTRNIDLAIKRRIKAPIARYEDKMDHQPSRETRISESNCNQDNSKVDNELPKVSVTASNNGQFETVSDDSEPIYAQI